ncbi:DUF3108 domain-containing protein [Trinickia fusca]|uniref:DUF3108 domain-containing protein n=1 Tax=Trinickia fusca TaxID=2419777 RepID=A0A494XHL9_9BURK|nr:DUF3108 domain-containing protein [Trinickia fusca]RKP49282.1 DUF3108 domain-containing protein [Trinickia fusca]
MPSPIAATVACAVPACRVGAARAWRWGVALSATLVLHTVAGTWIERHRDTFAPTRTAPPVQVTLLQPERIAQANTPAPAHSPGRARVTHVQRHMQQAEPVLQALDAQAAAPAAASAAVSTAAAASAVKAPAASVTVAAAANSTSVSSGVKFSVPPSGNLHYETFYNGVQNQPGTIRWHSDDNGYEMIVSVPLPFVGTFSYASRGRIDAFGLAPVRYVEQRGRRPEDVTTFDRDAKRIAFTRTAATLALPDGAQDRFSMVMQLASLVRGDPNAYTPGVTRAFYVADDDSGETWPIETIGDETVHTADGFVQARHFMRLPRHDGDRRRIDIWLAQSLGWLPARIVQTEPNGAQFELLWRGKLLPPGAENAPSGSEPTADDSSDTTPSSVYEKP